MTINPNITHYAIVVDHGTIETVGPWSSAETAASTAYRQAVGCEQVVTFPVLEVGDMEATERAANASAEDIAYARCRDVATAAVQTVEALPLRVSDESQEHIYVTAFDACKASMAQSLFTD